MHLLDASCAGEMECRLLVVPGDQARADSERMQAAHRFRGVGSERVAKCQQAEKHAFSRNADDGHSLRFELIDASGFGRDTHSFGREKSRAADDQPRIAEAGPYALTGDGLESLHVEQRETALERFL